MLFVRFHNFYAGYWNTTAEHRWPLLRPSRSGASYWIEFQGHETAVPTCCVRIVSAGE